MNGETPSYSLPLAQGELSPKDAAELQLLKEQIKRDIGFYCEGYKEHCLRRRIAVRMRARGMHSYAAYGELLKSDETEHNRLLDAITINVSKFFRNADLWRALDRDVVPRLFNQRERPVRIWSAGCAAGEEPYTIAMMLKEYAIRHARERELIRFDLLGTDIDQQSLAHAKTARYAPFAFTDIETSVREAWFEPPDFVEVKRDIRKMVRFHERDLIKDEFDAGYHLIMCRNVIIYFERAVQEALFQKFYDALAPGGFLVLGKVETIYGRAAALFKPLAPRERVFSRL